MYFYLVDGRKNIFQIAELLSFCINGRHESLSLKASISSCLQHFRFLYYGFMVL